MATQIIGYSYATERGVAGGLYDISPSQIDTRINGEKQPDKLHFGYGVVRGTVAGKEVVLPKTGAKNNTFEGVVLNGFNNQQEPFGGVVIRPKDSLNILKYGRVWVSVPESVNNIKYGDDLYLVTANENAGKFTNVKDGNVSIAGRFIGVKENGIAPVEIYNQLPPAQVTA